MAGTPTTGEMARYISASIASGTAAADRAWSGDSYAAAARRMEVNPTTVYLWETAQRHPRGRNVAIYYRYLSRLAAARNEELARSGRVA